MDKDAGAAGGSAAVAGGSAAVAADGEVAGVLAGWGGDIDELGSFNIEIEPDRTRDDIHNNRPGAHLREKILSLPESPGVYMYLNRHGKVIYVGKAKRLKRRVSSYFNRSMCRRVRICWCEASSTCASLWWRARNRRSTSRTP